MFVARPCVTTRCGALNGDAPWLYSIGIVPIEEPAPDASMHVAVEVFADIPPWLTRVYRNAAATCPGLPWEVLAAIGAIESGHGQGRLDPTTGDVLPAIYGPPLDGTHGTPRLVDPTSPSLWAHARGPMQFIDSSWRRWGRLAPGRPANASPSVDNAWDAIYSAAAYLCATVASTGDVAAAVYSYNHSDEYVAAVLAARRRTGRENSARSVDGPGAADRRCVDDVAADRRCVDDHHPGLPPRRHTHLRPRR